MRKHLQLVYPARRFLVILVFTLALTGTRSTAQVYEASIEELAQTSTSVVVGKAIDVRSFWNDDRTAIMTEVKLQVDERVGGDSASETIITIPGGRVGNSLYEVSDMPTFIEGEEVVVFLWQDPSGRNLVTGGAQGRIGITLDEKLGRRVLKTDITTPQLQIAVDDPATAPRQKVFVDQLIERIKEAREK